MRQSWSACRHIATATRAPNIAVGGQRSTPRQTTRKDPQHERDKPSKRSYGWVAERDFAWASRFRRLARDYERLVATLAGLHFLAFACLMLHQFTLLTLRL